MPITPITPIMPIPTVMPIKSSVMPIVFNSHLAMRRCKNVITPKAFHHEPPMVHSIAVQNMAVVEKHRNSIMRHKKGAQTEIPKMIVGNKREIIGTEAKIHVCRQHAVVI